MRHEPSLPEPALSQRNRAGSTGCGAYRRGREIDLANAAAVQRQVLGAFTSQLTEVALDLITLTYIDSAGLRVLFTLGTRLETLQIALQLLVPTESPIRK